MQWAPQAGAAGGEHFGGHTVPESSFSQSSIMPCIQTSNFAVSIMRRVRVDLEREHARILKQDPRKLFDWERIRATAREGDIGVDNTDPVFLSFKREARA
jgi:hypothetical protein